MADPPQTENDPPASTLPFERRNPSADQGFEIVLVTRGRALRRALRPGRRVVVGRDLECDLTVIDDNVSRRHVQLDVSESGVDLRDLGSSNGTFVRGARLEPSTPVPLRLYEPVELASSVLILQPASDPAHPSPLGRLAPVLSAPRDLALIERLATSEGPVAVVGPPGSGKTQVAHAIHELSRRAGPFEVVDIATINPGAATATLFGHRGTRAGEAVRGVLEEANGGTLALARVEELPAAAQRRLVQCIEHKNLTRVDEVGLRRADVSVILLTRDPLDALLRIGGIEPSLAHRLRGRVLELAALQERLEDLPAVVHALLESIAVDRGEPVATTPSPQLVDAIRKRPWPGNLRQLREVLDTAAALAGEDPLGPAHLGPAPTEGPDPPTAERRRILEALHRCQGNQTAAAKLLGVSRRTLINRIERFGIPRPRKSE